MADIETTLAGENVAETMRNTIEELSHHDVIKTPTPEEAFKGATIIDEPQGRTVTDLTEKVRAAAEYLKPARRKGVARMTDLASIINWSNRFKGDTSALFADDNRDAPKLTCIADYHGEGPIDVASDIGDPTARHCHHRAVYSFPMSDEWKAWQKISGVALAKDEMGAFIEENAKDFQDPTPAILQRSYAAADNADWEDRMIEIAQKIDKRFGQLRQLLTMSTQFQVYESSHLTVTSNRDTGESSIQFLDEHKDKDGAPISIPQLFIIAIPVFRNGPLWRLPVRFMYRKAGSDVKFTFTLYNDDKAFDAAFTEALETARTGTELPLFIGHPET